MVICLEQGADLHMTQLMPLPLTVSCFSKIQIGFTFLVPADPCSLGQMAVKRVCVCVSDMLIHVNFTTFAMVDPRHGGLNWLVTYLTFVDRHPQSSSPPFYGHYTDQPALAGTSC